PPQSQATAPAPIGQTLRLGRASCGGTVPAIPCRGPRTYAEQHPKLEHSRDSSSLRIGRRGHKQESVYPLLDAEQRPDEQPAVDLAFEVLRHQFLHGCTIKE